MNFKIAGLTALLIIKAQLSISQSMLEDQLKNAYQYKEGHFLDSALTIFQKVEHTAEHQKNWSIYVKALVGLSETFEAMGAIDRAVEFSQKSLKVSKKHLNAQEIAFVEALKAVGNSYFANGDFQKSKSYFLKALAKYDSLPNKDRGLEGRIHFDLGNIHMRIGAFDEALMHIQSSLNIGIDLYGQNDKDVASCYSSLGIIYGQRWQYKKSIDYFLKCIEIREQVFGERHPIVARSYSNLANVYILNGNFSKALDFYKQSLLTLEQFLGPKNPNIGRVYMNMGISYLQRKEMNQSLNSFDNAISIFSESLGENHPMLAEVLGQKSIALTRSREYNRAIDNLTKALIIQEKSLGPRSFEVARTFHNLGEAYRQIDQAICVDYFKKSIDILKELFGANHPMLALSHNELGRYYASSGDHQLALEHYQKALIANVPSFKHLSFKHNPTLLNFQDPTILLESLRLKAESLYQSYKFDGDLKGLHMSFETYALCDELMDLTRQYKARIEDKYQLGEVSQQMYQGGVAVCYELFSQTKDRIYLERIFHLIEKSRARVLTEKIAGSNARNIGRIPNALLSIEEETKSNLSYFTSQLQSNIPNQTSLVNEQSEIETTIFQLKNRLDSISEVFKEGYPTYYSLAYDNSTPALTSIMAKLPADQALLEYFESDNSLYLFLVHSKHWDLIKIQKDDQLEDNLIAFQSSIRPFSETDDFNASFLQFFSSSNYLYKTILAPALQQLPEEVNRLVIAPTGRMSNFPWDLLVTNDFNVNTTEDYKSLKYVLNSYAISYVHSAGLFTSNYANVLKSSRQKDMLAFAPGFSSFSPAQVSDLSEGFRDSVVPLNWNTQEIQQINELYNGKYFSGEKATEKEFKAHVSSHRMIHLATHALIDEDNFLASRLLFSKARDSLEDNKLHVYELLNMSIPAEMAVLSACNTGNGVVHSAEGILSLGNAFLHAGCQSVVLSHWSVADKSTSQLMTLFYRRISEGMTKDMAMQHAKIDFLKQANGRSTYPYYWGAFIVIGDTSPISINRAIREWIAPGFLIVLIILIIIFYTLRKRRNSAISTAPRNFE